MLEAGRGVRRLLAVALNLRVEANASAGVASRADGVGDEQNGVAIAVRKDLAHVDEVAGGGTFVPQLTATPTPKPGLSRLEGPQQRLLVHIGEHHYLARASVLDDGRNQAIGAVFHHQYSPRILPSLAVPQSSRLGMPRPARYCFAWD